MRRIIISILLSTAAAFAQSERTVWQPPTLDLPDTLPRATVSKEMITELRVAKMQVILEETPLSDVQKNLGGTIGARGDASEALQWLCFHGSDAKGRWALWLESSEMGGGNVDGFAWQRIVEKTTLDRRCRTQAIEIQLPIPLAIGLRESGVRGILGAPTMEHRNTLVFENEHQEIIRNEPFTASNTVYVELRSGVVWSVQVWKNPDQYISVNQHILEFYALKNMLVLPSFTFPAPSPTDR